VQMSEEGSRAIVSYIWTLPRNVIEEFESRSLLHSKVINLGSFDPVNACL
jgi:hypothetical protein